jgi:hypothetical protein
MISLGFAETLEEAAAICYGGRRLSARIHAQDASALLIRLLAEERSPTSCFSENSARQLAEQAISSTY